MSEARGAVFRIRFERLALVMVVFGQGLYWVLIVGVQYGMGFGPMNLPAIVAAGTGAGVIVWCCVAIPLILALLIRDRILPTGIRGHDGLGFPVTMRWDRIVSVKAYNIASLPYLLVRATAVRRTMWLPLFIRDYDHFAETVTTFAGPNHPVTVAVRARLQPDE